MKLSRAVFKSVSAFFLIVVLFGACSKDKNPIKPVDDDNDKTIITENAKLVPQFYSLSARKTVDNWDIMFHQVNRSPDLALNGGISGSAAITAKDLGVVDFNAAVSDMDNGFITDTIDSLVIGDKWYNYDFLTHTVSSKNHVYLVKSLDYKTYKLKINSYTGGVWQLTISPVSATGVPTNIQNISVTATATEAGYLSLSKAAAIAKADWDVALVTVLMYIPQMSAFISNPAMEINSVEGVEIAKVTGTAYDAITAVPAGLTYLKDGVGTLAIGTDVLIYNETTHKLTPPDLVYIVKGVDGKHYKLQITSYYNPDSGESGFYNFNYDVLD